MLELIAALSWVEVSAAAISILSVIGVLMNRAFLKPLKDEIDTLKEDHDDQEVRLRVVEKTQAEHGVEISTVKEVALKLVERMDRILDKFAEQQNKSDK